MGKVRNRILRIAVSYRAQACSYGFFVHGQSVARADDSQPGRQASPASASAGAEDIRPGDLAGTVHLRARSHTRRGRGNGLRGGGEVLAADHRPPADVCAGPYCRFSDAEDADTGDDGQREGEADGGGRRRTRRLKAQEVGRNQGESKDCPSRPFY